MSITDLDDLDNKILGILSRKRRRTADEIYFEISGFQQGKFGRSLVNLRLIKLSELEYVSIELVPGRDSQEYVYSRKKQESN